MTKQFVVLGRIVLLFCSTQVKYAGYALVLNNIILPFAISAFLRPKQFVVTIVTSEM